MMQWVAPDWMCNKSTLPISKSRPNMILWEYKHIQWIRAAKPMCLKAMGQRRRRPSDKHLSLHRFQMHTQCRLTFLPIRTKFVTRFTTRHTCKWLSLVCLCQISSLVLSSCWVMLTSATVAWAIKQTQPPCIGPADYTPISHHLQQVLATRCFASSKSRTSRKSNACYRKECPAFEIRAYKLAKAG